ncbi:EF-hand domain-containing protein [Prosthecobacter vanneervenii]|uniref:EF-hand domain-containing protein n=1 Tax=Prosthecobacter vanneervenii TaxID=48466 RepID=A0A7W8DN25_9BACT|nr:hypothetical protein [Prosthecobacter vanneervenii]MBB5035675.1 hypothetical protein [Prosthecobacter vanneervenii]
MKALSAFLLALSTFASLTQAEDAPKQRPGAGGAGGDYREKMQQLALQKFDANKNGVLDPDEKAAAMKAMQERKGGAPGAKGGPGKGPMQEMILQRFDANKNGVLDPDEKAAAMKAMQERKGKAGRPSFTPGTATDSGTSKFRRPPEAPKQGDATK